MIYSTQPPQSDPLTLLHEVATLFANQTQPAEVTAAYQRICELLWAVIQRANDSNAYLVSWKCVSQFGKPSLAHYQVTGDLAALKRLRELVKTTCECLP